MQKRTWLSVGSWVAIITVLWIIGWIIAEAIPVFNNLLALIVRAAPLPQLRISVLTFSSDGPICQLVYMYEPTYIYKIMTY